MSKNDFRDTLVDNDKDQTRIFFGWWTVLVTGLVSGLGLGFYAYGISALFKPIASELVLSRAVTSGGSGIGLMAGSLLAPLIGWTVDKFGPRAAIAGGLFTVSVGLTMMQFVSSALGFYLIWGLIIGIGTNLGLTIAVDKALTNWFVRKIGLAMGIKFALIGLTAALSMPVVSWLIARIGWRMTCLLWGALLLLGIPLIFAFVKNERPEFFGLLPDGDKKGPDLKISPEVSFKSAAADASGLQPSEFNLRQALRTRTYWILTLSLFLQFFVMAAFLIHPSIETIYLLLFFYGIAHGLPTPLFIISISRYFGRKAFGTISGTALMFMSPAAFISPVLAGWIFDTSGSYSAALMVFASASFIVIMLLSFLKTPKK